MWEGEKGGEFCSVCIFHNQKMHVYLIYVGNSAVLRAIEDSAMECVLHGRALSNNSLSKHASVHLGFLIIFAVQIIFEACIQMVDSLILI